MANRTALLFAVLVWLVACVGFPQEPVYELEGIVVTATRTPDKLREIPWAVRVISSRDIELRRAEDLGGLLRGELGIDIRSYGPIGQTSTIGLRGATANQVLVLVDGRPVNHIALGISDMSLLSLEGVERVEIVKGPISSLYGANALGGVVNVITKRVPAKVMATGRVSYGSLNTRVFEAEAGSKRGRLGLILSGSSRSSQGFRSNSDYEGKNAKAKVCYGEEGSHLITLSLGFERRALGIPGPEPAPGDLPVYGDSTATSLFDSQEDGNYYGDLSLSLQLSEGLALEAKSYLDRRDMDFFSVFQGYNPDWSTYRAELRDDYIATTLGGNLQFTLATSSDRELVLGLDSRRDRFEGSSEFTNTETGWADTTSWSPHSTSYGIWGEAKGKMARDLFTVGSLRYDRSHDYGSFLSPSLGLVRSFGNNSLKLSAGRAFRAPTFNDLYWPGAGNPELTPESGMAWEARLELAPSGLFLVTAALYGRMVEDLISWVPLEGGKWQPTNVDQFSEVGREVEIQFRPGRTLTLEGKMAFLTAGQKRKELVYSDWITGETRLDYRTRRAAYIPEVDGSISVSYEAPFGPTFGGELRYVGERVNYYPNYSCPLTVTMDEKRLPSAVLLGARVSQRFARFVEVFLKGENLLNREYAEQFGNSIADGNYPRPGRTLQAGLILSL